MYNKVSIVFATILDDTSDIAGRSPVTYYEFQWDNYSYDFTDPETFPGWVSLGTIAQDSGVTELTKEHS